MATLIIPNLLQPECIVTPFLPSLYALIFKHPCDPPYQQDGCRSLIQQLRGTLQPVGQGETGDGRSPLERRDTGTLQCKQPAATVPLGWPVTKQAVQYCRNSSREYTVQAYCYMATRDYSALMQNFKFTMFQSKDLDWVSSLKLIVCYVLVSAQ